MFSRLASSHNPAGAFARIASFINSLILRSLRDAAGALWDREHRSRREREHEHATPHRVLKECRVEANRKFR
jgi:hypothetical protein